jgi:hypothetical protein
MKESKGVSDLQWPLLHVVGIWCHGSCRLTLTLTVGECGLCLQGEKKKEERTVGVAASFEALFSNIPVVQFSL